MYLAYKSEIPRGFAVGFRGIRFRVFGSLSYAYCLDNIASAGPTTALILIHFYGIVLEIVRRIILKLLRKLNRINSLR